MCELIRKSGQWNLVLGSRVMAQGVNAVMSEVAHASLHCYSRESPLPPDMTAPETTCVLKMLYYICCVHVASCFAVVFCMPIWATYVDD